jgi:hypothetical protein
VRVLEQASAYGFTASEARTLLLLLKQAPVARLSFIPDANDVSHLASWVRIPSQITDGHLDKLAAANGAVLATLDESDPLVLDPTITVLRLPSCVGPRRLQFSYTTKSFGTIAKSAALGIKALQLVPRTRVRK